MSAPLLYGNRAVPETRKAFKEGRLAAAVGNEKPNPYAEPKLPNTTRRARQVTAWDAGFEYQVKEGG